MRSFHTRFTLRNFRRQKFYSFLLSLVLIVFCSLYTVVYKAGSVLDAETGRFGQGFVNMRYKESPLELNAMDLMGSRRHNRNLQNLFPRDLFDEKKKRLESVIKEKDEIRWARENDSTEFQVSRQTTLRNEYYKEKFTHKDNKFQQMTHKSSNGQTPTKKLPQAIIIGVKKCGTRALLEFLRIHPDVRATGPEPHFFDRFYDNGLDWYRNLMPATTEGQITIEKTPKYFITKDVPRKIYNMSRDIKLILVVRDPVTRAISDYTQVSSKRLSMKPFETMAILDNKTGMVDTSWAVIKVGTYAKHLEEWFRYFPLKQFHFVSGENMIKNPSEEMEKLQNFLGLKPFINNEHFYMNDTRGFPCIKKNGSKIPHCLLGTKGRKHPYVDKRVVKRLQNFYKPFNEKFYQMTGKDFQWP